MKARTWLGAVVAVVLSFTAAGAQDCEQLKRKADRAVRNWGRSCFVPTPLPSPDPTRSPAPTAKPTVVPDCSDGSFSKMANGFLTSRVVPEPGRTYSLCFTVPPVESGKSGNIRLDSASASDGSCDIYDLRLTSPSGVEYRSDGPSVVQGARQEAGRWTARLTLDPKLGPLCASKHGIEMWIGWW